LDGILDLSSLNGQPLAEILGGNPWQAILGGMTKAPGQAVRLIEELKRIPFCPTVRGQKPAGDGWLLSGHSRIALRERFHPSAHRQLLR